MKHHKGEMDKWHRHYFDHERYIIRGRLLNHPQFGLSSIFAHTSEVLEEKELLDGSIEIETANSRYTLLPKT